MANKRDYYEVLGVSKDASEQDIKSAFRKLSRKWHPDMQSGKSEAEKKNAEEKFKECAEAYETLSDKNKRSNYDQFGFNGPQMSGGFGGFDMGDFMRRHGGMFSGFFGGNPFGDDDFDPFGGFGRGQHSSPPNPNTPENGRDAKTRIDLDFNDVLFGCAKELKLKLSEECKTCHGTGVKPGSEVKTCSRCGGHGVVQRRIQNGFMLSISTSPCPDCGGSGYAYDRCHSCNGEKRVPAEKIISVNVPSGIETGQKLRVKGKGECGTCGGQNGDLYISVNVKKSDIFERDGLNLKLIQPISPITASLGEKVDVITPYGFYKMKVPAGTSSGDVLRIPGKGLKTSSGIGDMLVTVVIEPIQSISADQKKLMETLRDTLNCKNFKRQNELKQKANAFLEAIRDRNK